MRNSITRAKVSAAILFCLAGGANAGYQLQVPIVPSASSAPSVVLTNLGECPPSLRIDINGTLYAAGSTIPYPVLSDSVFWNSTRQGYNYSAGNFGFGSMVYGNYFWEGAGTIPVSWDATQMADGSTAPAGTGTATLDVWMDLTEAQVSDEAVAYWVSTGHVIPADYYWTRQTLQVGGATFSGNTPYVGGTPATEAQLRAALSAGYASTDPSVYYAAYSTNHAAADIAAELVSKAGVVPAIPLSTSQYVYPSSYNMSQDFSVFLTSAGATMQDGFKLQCGGYVMAY